MAEYEIAFICRNCGKKIDIIHPSRWAYKVKNNKGGHNYFCTWKCLREDERKKEKKQAARKEESEQRTWNNRKDVLEKMIAAAEAGQDIYEYLWEEGYTDPKDTLRRLRIMAKMEAPEIYDKMEKMGLLDMRAKNSGKGVDKMSKHKLTREQKEKAVDIAIKGGDPLVYLKLCGAKNPTAAWWYIKKTLATKNPQMLEKIPEKIGTVLNESGQATATVEIAEKLPPEAVAEVPERPEANQMKVTELEKTDDGVKFVVSVPPERAEQMDKVIKELMDPENDRLGLSLYKDAQRITEPLKYDGFKVTAINGEFGEYRVEGTKLYFHNQNRIMCFDVDIEEMSAFIDEITRAAQILGGAGLMEDYIVGFRTFGNSWAYISEVMPGKDGEKVYIYGTNNRKKARRFTQEEAEKIVKASNIDGVTVMKA